MKIGLVKHLNARPLTLFFENNKDYEPVYDNPSVLVEELKLGKLDCALISSIECERNKDLLDYTKVVGVCARDFVRSVLYFQNKNELYPPDMVYTDLGSRTSVALLQCLFYLETGKKIQVLPTNAKEISDRLEKKQGSHLLFGDHALLQKSTPGYQVRDLAHWWNHLTGLHFCFAFWAFPKGKPWEDSIFLKALSYGMSQLESIIETETRLPHQVVDRYLKQELHFVPEETNLKGFEKYIEICRTLVLI